MIQKLLDKKLPEIPEDIAEQIENKGKITLTDFNDKNFVLEDEKIQNEIGYGKLKDGNYLVSMTCPMPGITADMIRWWFWWHPQKKERYQAWFPCEHIDIGFDKKDEDYFKAKTLPSFKSNTQYPKERIGKLVLPLRIDFVEPSDFGFSQEIMDKNNIPLIVCGHVSAFKGLVPHTEMAHIFKQTDGGLLLISRFWIGKSLKNPLLRKFILNDKTAKGMAEHCCVEYRNLCEILPYLYNKLK